LCVRISDAALKEAALSLSARDGVELPPEFALCDSQVTSLLFALEAERKRGYPTGRLFLDSVERALAALLVISYGIVPAAPAQARGGLAPQRLRRVLEFMHANIGRQFTLQELAACAGLSASHFSHQFRRSTNATPQRYMLALRIEQSKNMLRDPKPSVIDVSLAAGFETPQYFATVFRRFAGVSPSYYRKQA
jgi:AraC family transcriptional regulator